MRSRLLLQRLPQYHVRLASTRSGGNPRSPRVHRVRADSRMSGDSHPSNISTEPFETSGGNRPQARRSNDEVRGNNIPVRKTNLAMPKSSTARSSNGTKNDANNSRHRESKVPRSVMAIPILHETPKIAFINKPPAILSQPGVPGEGTILDLLRYQRPDLQLQTVNRYAIHSQI
jgi:23S rRNA-/tRNA-specific pseudouridylate synthase